MLFIFDMGGVVTSTFQMDKIYEKLNLSKENFFKICKSYKKDLWQLLQTGKIDVNTFWNEFNMNIGKLQRIQEDELLTFKNELELAANLDLQNTLPVETDLFRLYFHPVINTKTVELINLLKKKHRVVCGTNTIQSHWENHVERGDYSYFDQTYASNKIGFAKPDPKFFEIILEAEGYSADQAFFVDDKIENCRAAESVGIKTVQMKTPDQLFEQWSKYAQ